MKKGHLRSEDERQGPNSCKKGKTIEAEEQEPEPESEYEENEDEAEEEEDRVKNSRYRGSDKPCANKDGSINVTLTDPEVLDCPICFEILTIPVFQCKNGHIACRSCCSKIKKKCPSCSSICYNRCRAIEKVLESIKVLCQNYTNGCKEPVIYCKKQDHEKTCIYAPCFCPVPGCNFVSNTQRLYTHFRSHQAKQFSFNRHFSISFDMECKYTILQERNDNVVFILNNSVSPLGNAVSVSCIALRSSNMEFAYNLIAKIGGCTVKLESLTEKTPRWVEEHPQKKFLLVPSDFIGFDRQIKLETRIRKLC